ncbi:uncharacterized protein FIBRA_00201 [Fibroporia radiculosa]|uniref:Uncharacterized protein n=1 Tax=Fibroporia radiculosa TaxID=599839 RepID=J7RGL4_9APHY|nr:uncharacterized protein FIBRA_00201 [Fibroporia radiculosa]CCL98207.1 predicted protein [Fibroporia radiculosa]
MITRTRSLARSAHSDEQVPAPRRSRLDSLVSSAIKRPGSTPPSSYAPSSYSHGQHEDDSYPNISVFRQSGQMEVHVRSPSVKMTRPPGHEVPRSLPVFDVHNKIRGTVLLDTSLSARPGRLYISMEGTFVHITPRAPASQLLGMPGPSGMHRHVFFFSTQTLPLDKTIGPRRSNSSLRDAIAASVRPRRERRPSQSGIGGTLLPFPFSFEAPPPIRPGEELPPTFCTTVEGLAGTRARAFVERSEIVYKLIATWESSAGDDRLVVEAPIIFAPETDFESLDGRSLEPESWVEIPLRSERPIPFSCAVAIPDVPSFPRSASVPYYVVFTTSPRSPTLAREIVLDATIAVSVHRQINIDTSPASPSTPSLASPTSPLSSSSSSSGSDFDSPSSFILSHKTKLMKRMVRSAPPIISRKQQLKLTAPVPPLPPFVDAAGRGGTEGYSETRTLFTDVYAGFPKRPRIRMNPGQQHPSMTALTLLPDGLYKSKVQLNKNMVPSIGWTDLSVKYYLEISVLFGQDESRARIPIRIV